MASSVRYSVPSRLHTYSNVYTEILEEGKHYLLRMVVDASKLMSAVVCARNCTVLLDFRNIDFAFQRIVSAVMQLSRFRRAMTVVQCRLSSMVRS